MKLVAKLYASLWALLIASFAGNTAFSQGSGFADQEEADWAQARREGTADAFQRYLERYPVGRHAAEAFGCSIDAGLCASDPTVGERPVTRGLSVDMY